MPVAGDGVLGMIRPSDVSMRMIPTSSGLSMTPAACSTMPMIRASSALRPSASPARRARGPRKWRKDQVDLALAGGVPLLVGEAFERVQVGPGGEVVQHVDPAELAHRQVDEPRALAGKRQGGGASHAPASTRDDADFPRQPSGHLSRLCELTRRASRPLSSSSFSSASAAGENRVVRPAVVARIAVA